MSKNDSRKGENREEKNDCCFQGEYGEAGQVIGEGAYCEIRSLHLPL